MIGLVTSTADPASRNIADNLRDVDGWAVRYDQRHPEGAGGGTYYRRAGFELRSFEQPPVRITDAADPFTDPQVMVFLSRHRGASGRILTSHFTGNFGPADLGGAPRSLARASPNAQSRLHAALREHTPPGFTVGVECTHHGPTDLRIPSMFVEIGSDRSAWIDPEAGRAVARAVLTLRDVPPDRDHTVVGIGGGHYAPRFDRIIRDTAWAVGHIAADWSVTAADGLDRELVSQLFERSNTTFGVTDGEHPRAVNLAETLGYRVVSETWLRETSGVSLALVADLEATVRSIEDGLRLGTHAAQTSSYQVYELTPDLLAATNGIDHTRIRETVHRHSVAYETADAGTRVTGQIALPDPTARERIIDGIVRVFQTRGDTVTREDNTIIVKRQIFDPDKARNLGVPEGPAFGDLAGGTSVEFDGRTITPAMVHTSRTRTYRITTE